MTTGFATILTGVGDVSRTKSEQEDNDNNITIKKLTIFIFTIINIY